MILQYRRTLLQYSVVRALTPGFRFTRVQTESEGTLPTFKISLKGVQCIGTPSMFGHGLIMVHTSEVARREWKPQENTEENKRY